MTPALLLLALACAPGSAPPTAAADRVEPVADSDPEPVADSDPEPAADDAPAPSEVGFALDLYRELATGDDNVFLSPLSVRMALTMVFAGAGGETRDAMARGLRLPQDADTVHADYGAWLSDLAADEERPYTLAVANRLWVQHGLELTSSFRETTDAHYQAGVEPLDLRGDPKGSRATINGWVSDRTRDKIPELLPQGFLQEGSTAVLTNAVYFKGTWKHAFDEDRTDDAPFTRLDGSTVDVPLMHQARSLQYAEIEGAQVLRLPYEGDRLSMIVWLPPQGGLDALEASLDPAGIDAARSALRTQDVQVWLPRFEHDTSYELVDPLTALGMGAAFSDGADFSWMFAETSSKIDKVVHKAFVAVDEAGTEAAAATAIGMVATSMAPSQPPIPKIFRADRPFVYALWDDEADRLLFLGRITDPS